MTKAVFAGMETTQNPMGGFGEFGRTGLRVVPEKTVTEKPALKGPVSAIRMMKNMLKMGASDSIR